jgi:serine/threonine protein kinase/ankyrin repeat protein
MSGAAGVDRAEEEAAEEARQQWKLELRKMDTDAIEREIDTMDYMLRTGLDARQIAHTKRKRALFAGTLKEMQQRDGFVDFMLEVGDSGVGGGGGGGGGVSWQKVQGAHFIANGQVLEKQEGGIDLYDSGASSAETIPSASAGGEEQGLSWTAATVGKKYAIGLSKEDVSVGYTSIGFAIKCGHNIPGFENVLSIYESGDHKGDFGIYEVGDRLAVKVHGDTVTYQRNGAVFYTSAQKATFPLMIDASFCVPGARATDVKLVVSSANEGLMQAIRSNDLSQVQQALVAGADVNCVESDAAMGAFTPLYLAAMKDIDMRIIRLLIDQGADVNTHKAGMMTGRNAYMLAQENHNEELAKLLLKNGATGSRKKKDEVPVEMPAAWELENAADKEEQQPKLEESWMYTAQMQGIKKNSAEGAPSEEQMQQLQMHQLHLHQLHLSLWRCGGGQRIKSAAEYLSAGADIEWVHPQQHTTVLMHAAMAGQSTMVRFLVGHGANVDACDDKQRSALALALRFKHVSGTEEVAKILRSAGAKTSSRESEAREARSQQVGSTEADSGRTEADSGRAELQEARRKRRQSSQQQLFEEVQDLGMSILEEAKAKLHAKEEMLQPFGVQAVLQRLKAHDYTLTTIELSKMQITDGQLDELIEGLRTMKQPLRELRLSDNCISGEGMKQLAELLPVLNNSGGLEVLDLANNKIGIQGAAAIYHALLKCEEGSTTGSRVLDLIGNPLDEQCVEYFRRYYNQLHQQERERERKRGQWFQLYPSDIAAIELKLPPMGSDAGLLSTGDLNLSLKSIVDLRRRRRKQHTQLQSCLCQAVLTSNVIEVTKLLHSSFSCASASNEPDLGLNDAGNPVAFGRHSSAVLYCGRRAGNTTSSAVCGPMGGENCADCKRCTKPSRNFAGASVQWGKPTDATASRTLYCSRLGLLPASCGPDEGPQCIECRDLQKLCTCTSGVGSGGSTGCARVTKLALAKVWERLQQVKQVQERGGLTEGGMERGGTGDGERNVNWFAELGGCFSRLHPTSEVLRLLLANEVDVWLDREKIALLDFRCFCVFGGLSAETQQLHHHHHPTGGEIKMMRQWQEVIVAPPSESLIHCASCDNAQSTNWWLLQGADPLWRENEHSETGENFSAGTRKRLFYPGFTALHQAASTQSFSVAEVLVTMERAESENGEDDGGDENQQAVEEEQPCPPDGSSSESVLALLSCVDWGCGSTPLAWACYVGDINMTRLLVKHGADPAIRSAGPAGEGGNALHWAVGSQSTNCVRLLLTPRDVSTELPMERDFHGEDAFVRAFKAWKSEAVAVGSRVINKAREATAVEIVEDLRRAVACALEESAREVPQGADPWDKYLLPEAGARWQWEGDGGSESGIKWNDYGKEINDKIEVACCARLRRVCQALIGADGGSVRSMLLDAAAEDAPEEAGEGVCKEGVGQKGVGQDKENGNSVEGVDHVHLNLSEFTSNAKHTAVIHRVEISNLTQLNLQTDCVRRIRRLPCASKVGVDVMDEEENPETKRMREVDEQVQGDWQLERARVESSKERVADNDEDEDEDEDEEGDEVGELPDPVRPTPVRRKFHPHASGVLSTESQSAAMLVPLGAIQSEMRMATNNSMAAKGSPEGARRLVQQQRPRSSIRTELQMTEMGLDEMKKLPPLPLPSPQALGLGRNEADGASAGAGAAGADVSAHSHLASSVIGFSPAGYEFAEGVPVTLSLKHHLPEGVLESNQYELSLLQTVYVPVLVPVPAKPVKIGEGAGAGAVGNAGGSVLARARHWGNSEALADGEGFTEGGGWQWEEIPRSEWSLSPGGFAELRLQRLPGHVAARAVSTQAGDVYALLSPPMVQHQMRTSALARARHWGHGEDLNHTDGSFVDGGGWQWDGVQVQQIVQQQMQQMAEEQVQMQRVQMQGAPLQIMPALSSAAAWADQVVCMVFAPAHPVPPTLNQILGVPTMSSDANKADAVGGIPVAGGEGAPPQQQQQQQQQRHFSAAVAVWVVPDRPQVRQEVLERMMSRGGGGMALCCTTVEPLQLCQGDFVCVRFDSDGATASTATFGAQQQQQQQPKQWRGGGQKLCFLRSICIGADDVSGACIFKRVLVAAMSIAGGATQREVTPSPIWKTTLGVQVQLLQPPRRPLQPWLRSRQLQRLTVSWDGVCGQRLRRVSGALNTLALASDALNSDLVEEVPLEEKLDAGPADGSSAGSLPGSSTMYMVELACFAQRDLLKWFHGTFPAEQQIHQLLLQHDGEANEGVGAGTGASAEEHRTAGLSLSKNQQACQEFLISRFEVLADTQQTSLMIERPIFAGLIRLRAYNGAGFSDYSPALVLYPEGGPSTNVPGKVRTVDSLRSSSYSSACRLHSSVSSPGPSLTLSRQTSPSYSAADLLPPLAGVQEQPSPAAVVAAAAAASPASSPLPPQVSQVFDALSIDRLLGNQSSPLFTHNDLYEHLYRTSLVNAPLVGLLLRLLERSMFLMQDRAHYNDTPSIAPTGSGGGGAARAQRGNCQLIVNRMWTAIGLNIFTLAQSAHYPRLVDASNSIQNKGPPNKDEEVLRVCAAAGPLGQLVKAVAAVVQQVQRCTPPTPGWLARFLLASGEVDHYVSLQRQLAEALTQCASVVGGGSGPGQMQHAVQALQAHDGQARTYGYEDEPSGSSNLLKRNARQVLSDHPKPSELPPIAIEQLAIDMQVAPAALQQELAAPELGAALWLVRADIEEDAKARKERQQLQQQQVDGAEQSPLQQQPQQRRVVFHEHGLVEYEDEEKEREESELFAWLRDLKIGKRDCTRYVRALFADGYDTVESVAEMLQELPMATTDVSDNGQHDRDKAKELVREYGLRVGHAKRVIKAAAAAAAGEQEKECGRAAAVGGASGYDRFEVDAAGVYTSSPAPTPSSLSFLVRSEDVHQEAGTPLLGFGFFGAVHIGVWRGERVAVKSFKPGVRSGMGDNFQRELGVVCTLRHPRICQFLGASVEKGREFILSELMAGSLYDWLHGTDNAASTTSTTTSSSSTSSSSSSGNINGVEAGAVAEDINSADFESAAYSFMPDGTGIVQRREPLNAEQKRSIARDVSCGVYYLHCEGVLHRDLTTRNILLDSYGRAKVSDFGLAKQVFKASTGAGSEPGRLLYDSGSEGIGNGNLLYAAPEVLRGGACTAGSDVYSFGTCVWEMFSGQRPFDGVREEGVAALQQLLTKAGNGDLDPARFVASMGTTAAALQAQIADPLYQQLISQCWDTNAPRRPQFVVLVQQLGEE